VGEARTGKFLGVGVDRDDRLRGQIAECDAIVQENDDSADPVARRRALDALIEKQDLVACLGDDEQMLVVCDELLDRFGDDPPAGDDVFVTRTLCNQGLALRRCGRELAALRAFDEAISECAVPAESSEARLFLARALAGRREALTGLDRFDEAIVVDGQILAVCGTASHPELRRRAAAALTHRALLRLREGRVDAALGDSEELVRRFVAETDPETARRVARLLVSHAGAWLQVGRPSSSDLAVAAMVTLVGAVVEAIAGTGRQLPVPLAGVRAWQVGLPVGRSRLVVPLIVRRRRAQRALAVSLVIVTRFESDADAGAEEIVAAAGIVRACALIQVGRVREGFRRFDELTGSGKESVAEAFRAQALLGSTDDVIDELGMLAGLWQRAATLGHGDSRIARIAFEESTRPGARGEPRSRMAKRLARFLTPREP